MTRALIAEDESLLAEHLAAELLALWPELTLLPTAANGDEAFERALALTPELLWQLRRVSEPQLSPDGTKLIYNVRTTDLAADKGTGQIVLLDLRNGEKRPLTSAGSNARPSRDGIY